MAKRTLSVQIDGKNFSRQTSANYTHVLSCKDTETGQVYICRWSTSEWNASKKCDLYGCDHPKMVHTVIAIPKQEG